MKRYFSAFALTLLCYIFLIILTINYFKQPKVPIKLNEEKKISLNHISVIQQKKVVQQLKPTVKKKKEKKRIERKKPILKEVKTRNQIVKKQKIKKQIAKKSIEKKVEKRKVIEQKQEKKSQEKLVKTVLKRDYKKEFIHEHLKKIVALIQKNIYYPKRAKMFNVQGKVIIEFTLTKEGLTKEYKTIQGHKLLQRSTIKAIEKASKFFPKVKKELRLVVPVVYKLT